MWDTGHGPAAQGARRAPVYSGLCAEGRAGRGGGAGSILSGEGTRRVPPAAGERLAAALPCARRHQLRRSPAPCGPAPGEPAGAMDRGRGKSSRSGRQCWVLRGARRGDPGELRPESRRRKRKERWAAGLGCGAARGGADGGLEDGVLGRQVPPAVRSTGESQCLVL